MVGRGFGPELNPLPAASAAKPGRLRFLRVAAATLLLLALAGAAGYWLWRDLPRRRVETGIEQRLGAEVDLGGLSILGTRRFALHDVVITRMSSQPRLARLWIGTLHVQGSLGDILDGKFESLRAVDLEARLAPVAEDTPPPDASAEPLQPQIGQLLVEKGRIVLGAGKEARPEDVVLEVEGSLTGVGGPLEGRLLLQSDRIGLKPLLLALLGPGPGPLPGRGWPEGSIDHLSAEVRISEEGMRIEANPRAERIVLVGGESKTLTLPDPEATILYSREGADGPLHVAVHPKLSFVESAVLEASFQAASWELMALEADVRGLDLDTIATFLSLLPEGWEIAGKADVRADGGKDAIVYAVRARVPRVGGPLEGGSLMVEGVTLDARGSLPQSGGTSTPTEIELSASSASGVLNGYTVPADVFPLTARFEGKLLSEEATSLDGTTIVTTRSAGVLRTDGVVRLGSTSAATGAGTSTGPVVDLRWRWSVLDLAQLLRLAEQAGAPDAGSYAIAGAGEGGGTLEGPLSALSLAGTVKLSSLEASMQGSGTPPAASGTPPAPSGTPPPVASDAGEQESAAWSLRGGTAAVRFDWRAPKGRIALTSVDASGEVKIDPLAPFRVSLSASGGLDPSSGELAIEKSVIEGPAMFRARAQGRGRLWRDEAPEQRASGVVTFDAVDLSRLKDVLRPVIGDPAQGYDAQGSIEGEVTAALEWNGTWNGRGKAATQKSGFSSQDGSQVLQGLDTRWDIEASGDAERPLVLRAAADVGGFELLWGSFYAAGGTLTSKVDIEAEIRSNYDTRLNQEGSAGRDGDGAGAWRCGAKATWVFPEGPRASLSIETAPELPTSYAIRFEAPDLGGMLDRYLRGPLGDSFPLIEKVTAAGSVRLEGRGTVSDRARTFDGRLTIAGMRLAGTEGLAEVQGLDLDLPVDIRWEMAVAEGQDPVITGEPRRGRASFARLTLRGLEVPSLATDLRVRADSVSLVEALPVKILDGTLVLQQMTLTNLLRPERSLEAAVRLEGLSMEAATEAFGMPPIVGRLEGGFPHVRMTPGTLEVEGGGEVRVFGGSARVGKISGEDILSRYPKMTFSTEFEGIDLGQATRRFDFGEITGIVRGYVRDCVMFGSVPVAFDALVETEERRGVPRTINVKAIKNLTVLGTGATSSVFDRGLQKLFDKYTYDRIGIQVTLQDDQTLLRGLERSGGKEMFVKGRLPFPINVINAQPGTPVSFQDMVERLKSLDLGKASVQP